MLLYLEVFDQMLLLCDLCHDSDVFQCSSAAG